MIKFIVTSYECPSGHGWQRIVTKLTSTNTGRSLLFYDCHSGNVTSPLLHMGYTWNEIRCLTCDVKKKAWRQRWGYNPSDKAYSNQDQLTAKNIDSLCQVDGRIGR